MVFRVGVRSFSRHRHETVAVEAHRLATLIEERLPVELEQPAEVITHLESLEDHEDVHSVEHYTGRPR
jgi:hypothetical protein